MGCQASKDYEAVVSPTKKAAAVAASSKGSLASETAAAKQSKVAAPAPSSNLYSMLIDAKSLSKGDLKSFWPNVIDLSESEPPNVKYVDPTTKSTPLHIACSMIDYDDGTADDASHHSVIAAVRSMIKQHPDGPSMVDSKGAIPLHYAIAKTKASSDGTVIPARWAIRAAVIRLLASADFEGSQEYFSKNNIIYDKSTGGCTPLYHALQSIPDDFTSPGATIGFLSVLQECNPRLVSVGNASDADKPLSLLYRRFTRQFDISEKFFPGDNSRAEVVNHRRDYKIAAGNTWKIIEILLRPEGDPHQPWKIVHRAVQVETPPDLLRYIVETNAEDLTQLDESGNLPIHYAAKSLPNKEAGPHAFPSFYTKYVVDELLYKFPEAASIPDGQGQFAFTLAVDTGKQWIGGGVKSLYDAYPQAVDQVDLEQHTSVKAALSFAEELEANKEVEEESKGIIRDEHHDAIMLVQKEGVDVSEVVCSMWAHEEDAGLQMLGCVALTKLCKLSNSDVEILRVSLGAVAAIVNAMKAHPNEPIVQDKACSALRAMAAADGKREVSFVASGAVAAVVGAMQAHIGDPAVQEEACGAIAAIVTYGGADRATIVASVSGMTAIVNSLAAHPNVVGVQEAGCNALKAITDFPDAFIPELPRSQTEAILESAKANFAQECGEAVDIVLSKLS